MEELHSLGWQRLSRFMLYYFGYRLTYYVLGFWKLRWNTFLTHSTPHYHDSSCGSSTSNPHHHHFKIARPPSPSPPPQISSPSIATLFSPSFTIISPPPYLFQGGIDREFILIKAYPFSMNFLLWILLFSCIFLQISQNYLLCKII